MLARGVTRISHVWAAILPMKTVHSSALPRGLPGEVHS